MKENIYIIAACAGTGEFIDDYKCKKHDNPEEKYNEFINKYKLHQAQKNYMYDVINMIMYKKGENVHKDGIELKRCELRNGIVAEKQTL